MVHIRKYRSEDAEELLQLFKNTVRHINSQDYSESQIEAWASDDIDWAEWCGLLAHNRPLVALVEGIPVGYADVQDNGLIDHFFCHYLYQGQGIGRTLMTCLFSEAEEKGIDRLHAYVSITARPFFEYFGFSVEAEQEVTIRDQGFTHYLMAKVRS